MEAKGIDIFTAEIDRFLIRAGVRGYVEKAGEWGREGKKVSYGQMAEQARWAEWR